MRALIKAGIGVLAMLAVACDLTRPKVEPPAPTDAMPLRCKLTSFTYDDRVTMGQGVEVHLGPELQGDFVATREAIAQDGIRAWWDGTPGGVLAYWRYVSPGNDNVDWMPLIAEGVHRGAWKLQGGKLWWSFDSDSQGIPWIGWRGTNNEGGWIWEPPNLTAHWGDYEALGWQLRSAFAC